MQLILAITTVVFPSPHLFWGTRTGTCRVFVYMLLHGIPWEYLAVLYIVGKVFSSRIQRRQLQEVWRRTHCGCQVLLGINRLAQISDIGAFLSRLSARSTSPLRVTCSPPILRPFQPPSPSF